MLFQNSYTEAGPLMAFLSPCSELTSINTYFKMLCNFFKDKFELVHCVRVCMSVSSMSHHTDIHLN